MLNQTANRAPGTRVVAGGVTTLSVSWLNRQFKAVAVQRGVLLGQWEYPGEVEGVNQFEGLIRQAVQRTGYRGQTVNLVLSHARLVQQTFDVPPVKTAALRKILQRQALQQKMFTGEAAWCSQLAPVGKAAQRVVLHLLPRPVLNQLIQGCHNNGLFLTSVSPPSGVLQQQLRLLPLDKGQVALLAAETGGSTTAVIGRNDGQVLLARTLSGNWNESAEQLATDLHRTILFFNEQFGVLLNRGVWLFGPGAEQQCQEVQRHTNLPVALSPAQYDPYYWAIDALKVRPAALPNFISPEMQHAPRRQVFAKVVAAVTTLMVLLLLGVSAYALLQARREAANIRSLFAQQQRLQTQRHVLELRNLRLANEAQVAGMVLDDRPPPVPLWLLGYLSDAVPPELVVTNFHVVRQAQEWDVHLAGTRQLALRNATRQAFAQGLEELTARLTNSPFHLELVDAQHTSSAAKRSKGDAIAAWVANVTKGIPAKPPPPTDDFELEGFLR